MSHSITNLTRLLSHNEQERLARYKLNAERADKVWELLSEIKHDTAGSNHNINHALTHMMEYGEHISAVIKGVERNIEQGDKNEQETGSREFAISPGVGWDKVPKQSSGSSE